MKNQEIALKAYAAATLRGNVTCQQEAWTVWKKSTGEELPEDYYEQYFLFFDDNEWYDFAEEESTKKYLEPYLAIKTLEQRSKIFKEYVESNEVTIASLKSVFSLPSTKAYLEPYLRIETLEHRARIFEECVKSNEETIASLKSGLLAQLTQDPK